MLQSESILPQHFTDTVEQILTHFEIISQQTFKIQHFTSQ